jgi:hypothetical protein
MHSDDYKAFLALRKLSHAEAAALFGATSRRTSEGWACGRAELPGHVTILLHLYTVMPEALARVQQLRAPPQAAPARQAPAKKGARPRKPYYEIWQEIRATIGARKATPTYQDYEDALCEALYAEGYPYLGIPTDMSVPETEWRRQRVKELNP